MTERMERDFEAMPGSSKMQKCVCVSPSQRIHKFGASIVGGKYSDAEVIKKEGRRWKMEKKRRRKKNQPRKSSYPRRNFNVAEALLRLPRFGFSSRFFFFYYRYVH